MKSSLIRPALALALAASLAACGGSDKAEFTVSGAVRGLDYENLILTNNGVQLKIAPPAKAGDPVKYAFAEKLEYGDTYNVMVAQDPDHQTCVPVAPEGGYYVNNADTAGRLVLIDINFNCTIDTHLIGGTITGLTADGLVLANGSTGGTAALPKPTTTTPVVYQLPRVAFGTTYGVTVTSQPTGQVCTIVNATGTMRDDDISNINVTCVAA